MRDIVRILFGTALLAPSGVASAASQDIAGMWNFRFSEWESGKVPPEASLTQAAAERVARQEAAMQAGHVRSVANMLCLPPGFPGMMLYRTPIQILSGFGRIEITAESAIEPRTIYLEKDQVDQPDPSWNGHSVGRWEGDTLVVDTIGLNGRSRGLWNIGRRLPGPSEKARITERLQLQEGGNVLAVTFTVADPANYTAPYSVTVHYDRMPSDSERMEAVCEVDLEALKEIDLEAIKDVDAEAMRILEESSKDGIPEK